VDHGKCERANQYVLLDGVPVRGVELIQRARKSGVLLGVVDGGEIYRLDANHVISIDKNFQPIKAESMLYVEHYVGPMFAIKGKTGRELSVTPEHPLLINRTGVIQWTKAKEIREGDYAAFMAQVPLDETLSLPDPFPNLKESYLVVTWEDAQRIGSVTLGFTEYAGLATEEFEKTRILLGLRKGDLLKTAHLDHKTYQKIITGAQTPSPEKRSRILKAFEFSAPLELRPDEFLTEGRKSKSSRRIRKTRHLGISPDIVRWFAFVWSEGNCNRSTVTVTQTVQKRMLTRFLEITRDRLGQQTKGYAKGRYSIYSTPFVDYLRFRFGFRPGNETVCGIADWVCKLPRELKSLFLRWFTTLDGEFNSHAGHISITQLNENNIVILSYLFHSFGIVPKFNIKRSKTKKGIKEYHRLTISGRKDLGLFANAIGFEDSTVQSKLVSYLSSIKKESKETDRSIPVDVRSLQLLLRETGLMREGFNRAPPQAIIKTTSWYRAYADAIRTGRLSRTKLLLVIGAFDRHLRNVEASASNMSFDGHALRKHAALLGISLTELSTELGTTRKVLSRILRKGSTVELRTVARYLKAETRGIIHHALQSLNQLRNLASSSLEFDRIVEVRKEDYDGLVFDLTVPEHANFIAGKGATICHNTSIVQAITGVWASAHSEELKRGITIKVGYADAAFYKCPVTPPPECYSTSPVCPVCGSETKLLRAVSFVDTPGHESLMTNMLAGAALMDGVILVIAANEPVPMPQTREHLLALQMLGMKKMVVVQNKIDRVDSEGAKKNYEAIKQFLANTVGADAPIIPVSAQNRINIDALIEAIEERIPTPKHDLNVPPQMYVLRSFDVNRPGADVKSLVGGVLGGSLVKGELRVGDEIEIAPGIADEKTSKYTPISTKVASLGTGAGMTDKVGPGGLIALGTTLDPRLTKGDILVGNLVGKPHSLPPVKTHISLDLQLFDQAVGSSTSSTLIKVDKIKAGETLRLNIGTASTLGTVTSARETVAELDLKKPVAVEDGSRAAISRRIAERWRLIGSGLIH